MVQVACNVHASILRCTVFIVHPQTNLGQQRSPCPDFRGLMTPIASQLVRDERDKCLARMLVPPALRVSCGAF